MTKTKYPFHELQLTQDGVDKFFSLLHTARMGSIEEEDARVMSTMFHLIWLHPLGYPHYLPFLEKMGKKTKKKDFLDLIEKGYAEHVGDTFLHMSGILVDHQEGDLLFIFETYRKIVYQQEIEASDVMMAIEVLEALAHQDNELLRIQGGLLQRLQEAQDRVWKALRKPQERATAQDFGLVLDAMVHEVHFDPDLLRHHEKNVQPVITAAIIRWLDHLAGGTHKRWMTWRELEEYSQMAPRRPKEGPGSFGRDPEAPEGSEEAPRPWWETVYDDVDGIRITPED